MRARCPLGTAFWAFLQELREFHISRVTGSTCGLSFLGCCGSHSVVTLGHAKISIRTTIGAVARGSRLDTEACSSSHHAGLIPQASWGNCEKKKVRLMVGRPQERLARDAFVAHVAICGKKSQDSFF